MFPDSATPAPGGPAGLAVSLLLVAALGWAALRPTQPPLPSPAPLITPATQFSAARAANHVAVLARTPRPIASQANRAARDYLVGQLHALGLAPQVQRATVLKNIVDYNANYESTMAVVHNVLVRLPGTKPGSSRRPALLLAAHYDSDVGSLRASSSAAPSAALLETLRALRAGPPLANDVVVLFADGERVGSLGMQAFVEQHPWAREVGLALRFDGAGSGGPLELVNMHGANGAAIDGWLRAVPDVRGSSLMHEVDRLAPRGLRALQLGALNRLEAPVLQFANRGRPFDRAGVLDTPQQLQPATLQHMGSAMLRLTRHFGAQAIDPQVSSGRVVFSLPFVGTVHYGGAAVWVFTSLACLLLVGVVCIAMRRSGVRYLALLQAGFILPTVAVALGVFAWQLWMHVPALHRAWNPAAPSHTQYALLYLSGVAALCAGLFTLALRALQRLTGLAPAMLAGLAGFTLVLILASWVAPGASYLVAWPLLAALASFAALHARRVAAWRTPARLALLLAGVLPAVLLVAPALRDTFLVLSPHRMNLPVAMLVLVLCASMLLLAHARRYLARVLLLGGLGGLALAGSADEVTEAPAARADGLVYYKDMPSWNAYWLHPDAPLDAWQRRLFSNLKQPHIFVNVFGWQSPKQWYAWAPRDGLEFPFVRVLRNGKAPDRHADFTLVSKNRAPEIRLQVNYARPTRVTLNGRTLLDTEAKSLTIVLYGMEDEQLHFRVNVLSDPIFNIKIEEILPGLPERLLHTLPARPGSALPPGSKSVASDTLWFY